MLSILDLVNTKGIDLVSLNASQVISPARMKLFSVDKLHMAWQKLGPPPETDPVKQTRRLKGLKEDLAVTCILGRGNDYLPPVHGTSSPGDALGKYCNPSQKDNFLDY